MMRAWVQFARTGNPNHEGMPQWPAVAGAAPQVLDLNEKIQPIAAPEPVLCGIYRQRLNP
jgi:para-nitrobenzyl esterase